MHKLTFELASSTAAQPGSCKSDWWFDARTLVWIIVVLASVIPARAEMVSIKWRSSAPVAWIPGNDFIDGYTPNFMDGTVEEKGKTKKDGELEAELIVPKGAKGPIPSVIMMHGCSHLQAVKPWAHEYAGKLVGAGYGVLILDSFTTRGVGTGGICADPSQLNWARRRADDAYSALDWLIETGKADPSRVYVLGRSNGAASSLIVMNKKIGAIQKNKFAGAFVMQPSCAYLKFVEFYAPVHLYLAEKDTAANPAICADMAASNRPIPVQVKIWKGITHSYEDRGPPRTYPIAGKIVKLEYNATAADGTITAIVNILNSHKASSAR
jgi:dienelactone hydrolase